MKKPPLFLILLLATSGAFGYDAELAQRFDQFYRPFDGKTCAKALQMIPPAKFIEAVKSGTPLFVLDVRTPGETGIYGVTLPDSHAVPMGKVFTTAVLEKIPTGQKVIIVCKSGARATAIAMGLRQIGFKDVYVLKGGLMALSKALDPKIAY